MHIAKLPKKVYGIIKTHKNKLPSSTKIEDLMNNWDSLSIFSESIDLTGCVILDGDR